jgi:phosphotransferase system HPr-like phosphotransfer protein
MHWKTFYLRQEHAWNRGETIKVTTIPRLLELLVLKGAMVTIDAKGRQKAVAWKIHRGRNGLSPGVER